MRKSTGLLVLLALLSPVAGHTATLEEKEPASRLRLRFDADWRFKIDDAPPNDPSEWKQGIKVEGWKWQMTDSKGAASGQLADPNLDLSGANWKELVKYGETFNGKAGLAWYRAILPKVPKPGPAEIVVLHFECVDDNGTVYLNGKKLMCHEGHYEPFDVPLSGPEWKEDGPNLVAVLVDNTGGAGGMMKEVTLRTVPRQRIMPVPESAREGFDDSGWRKVRLPHDYVVEGDFDPSGDAGHGSLPTPKGWYRRTFTIPPDWRGKSIWIDFDGVYSDSKIWFNGQCLGGCRSGYIGKRYRLDALARYGEINTLFVQADPSRKEGWWYEGGGIYRHVWINVADRLHIEPWGLFVKSELQDGQNSFATLEIKASVVNDAAEAHAFDLDVEVAGPDGKKVASVISETRSIKAGDKIEMILNAKVSKPRLWSLESPNLYRLSAKIRSRGQVVDQEGASFGIRTVRFDPDNGFFLNGKPVKIKGTCNHQDFAGIGIALPDGHHEWRVRKLLAVGCNAYRTSHNPVAPEMLDACDRLGMLVLNETRHFGDTYAQKSSVSTPFSDLSDWADMVRRDRNHPCVIAWSIANEEVGCERTPEAEAIALAMKAKVNLLDGTRPVTAAGVEHFAGYPGLSKAVDIEGFNYGPPQNYDRYHQLHPQRPKLATETASAISTRGFYGMEPFKHGEKEFWGDPARGYINGYGLSPDRNHAASECWKAVAERPFVAGAFVWTGFDYRGEPHPFKWPVVNSHFGFMDTCGFPKDDYFYYLAWWGSEPVVHVAPHWNWPSDKGKVKVLCHGNTESVELWLNGKSLGAKAMPKYGCLEWEVSYEPGTLEARGFNAGKRVASGKVETTGVATGLVLKADRKKFLADCEDQSPVEVMVVDASGRVVPTADNLVSFSVSGPGLIAGVGNGNPSSHEREKADKRQAFNGRCLAVVQASGLPGRITLTASSPGLKPATIHLRTLPASVASFDGL